MIKKFRKKPVVIQAVLYDGSEQAWNAIIEMGCTETQQDVDQLHDFHIKTLEGLMLCKKGDYVIKGIKGEFYPCKPDIFEATYEEELSHD